MRDHVAKRHGLKSRREVDADIGQSWSAGLALSNHIDRRRHDAAGTVHEWSECYILGERPLAELR